MNENNLEEEEIFDTTQFTEDIVRKLWDLKTKNVVAIDLRGRVSYADYIVIGTGTSARHLQSIGNQLIFFSKSEYGVVPLGEEGLGSGDWGLIDLGDVIVHIFNGDVREEYDFEKMWADAPRLPLDELPENLKELYGTFELDQFSQE